MADTTKELTLAEIQAKRAAVAARIEVSVTAAEDSTAVARETQGLADDEAWAAALEAHGAKKVAKVETELGAIILKRPHVATFRRFSENPKSGTGELLKYITPSVLYPDGARFLEIVNELPAVVPMAARVCTQLAGYRGDDLTSK